MQSRGGRPDATGCCSDDLPKLLGSCRCLQRRGRIFRTDMSRLEGAAPVPPRPQRRIRNSLVCHLEVMQA